MPTIRILTCSKGKPQTIRVTEWYAQEQFTDYTVVLCADDDVAAYRERVQGEIVQCPADCRTLTQKKKWMVANLIGRGDWALSLDDNIKAITDTTGRKLGVTEFLAAARADIERAENSGVVHGGFASNSNAYFRQKRYRTVGFVWGKACYFRNVGLPWLEGITEMDDYAATGEALLHTGRVLIDNQFYAEAARYEAIGGTGSYEQRIPEKTRAVQYILAAFPDLYRIANRPNLAPNTEIRMRFHSEEQIAKWRQRMLQA